MNYLEILSALDIWLSSETCIDAAAMAGVYRRPATRPEVDLEILVLTDAWTEFTDQLGWLDKLFPIAREVSFETWDAVHSVRFKLADVTIELNFCALSWAEVPVAPHTANMAAGGLTIMKDAQGRLQSLLTAVADGDIVNIRTHLPDDAQAIAQLFYDAVHALPDTHYNSEQKQAWAPELDSASEQKWQQRIEKSRPFVAEYEDQIVGFIELEIDGHIDCFYVAPRYQGKGIGGQLYQALVNEARGFGLRELRVDASHAARAFFSQRGFHVEQENTVNLSGVTLTNWRMTLAL